MSDLKGRQLASKWVKTAALLTNPEVASHIPETRPFTKKNLRAMLEAHRMVVIKPIVGAGGHGVIKVKISDTNYSFRHKSNKQKFKDFGSLYESLKSLRKGRAYMIQKGIRLAVIDGRPVDYRVKFVKAGEEWEFRAIVGRIARPGLFVTNLCQGGTLVRGAEGISRSFTSAHVKPMKRTMRKLTIAATRTLEGQFPGINQLGYDYGIDKDGEIWILEVNTRPQ